MSDAEFDCHAGNYRRQHEQRITSPGVEPACFAEYRPRGFMAPVAEAGLPGDGGFIEFGIGIGVGVGVAVGIFAKKPASRSLNAPIFCGPHPPTWAC